MSDHGHFTFGVDLISRDSGLESYWPKAQQAETSSDLNSYCCFWRTVKTVDSSLFFSNDRSSNNTAFNKGNWMGVGAAGRVILWKGIVWSN
jgi:hypothetical protein